MSRFPRFYGRKRKRPSLPPALREIFLPFVEAWERRSRRRRERAERKARLAARAGERKSFRQRMRSFEPPRVRFPNIPALQEIFLPWAELYRRIRRVKKEEPPAEAEEIFAAEPPAVFEETLEAPALPEVEERVSSTEEAVPAAEVEFVPEAPAEVAAEAEEVTVGLGPEAEEEERPSDLFPEYPPSFELPERRLRVRRAAKREKGRVLPRLRAVRPRLPRLRFPSLRLPRLRLPSIRRPRVPVPKFPKISLPNVPVIRSRRGRPTPAAATPPPPPRPPRRRPPRWAWDEVPDFKFFRRDPWRAADRIPAKRPRRVPLPRISLGPLLGAPMRMLRAAAALPRKAAGLAVLPFALSLRLARAILGAAGRVLGRVRVPAVRLPRRAPKSRPEAPRPVLPETAEPTLPKPPVPELEPAAPRPGLPKLRVPRPRLPRLPLPQISLPRLRFPKVSLPKFSLPRPSLPKLRLPKPSFPKPSLPKLTLPRPRIPKISLPKLALPKLHFPKISLPRLKFPSVRLSLPRLPFGRRKEPPALERPAEKLPVPEAPEGAQPAVEWPQEVPPAAEWPEETPHAPVWPEETPEGVAAAAQEIPTPAPPEQIIALPAREAPAPAMMERPRRVRLIRVLGPFSAFWGRIRSLLRLPSGIPFKLRRRVPVRRPEAPPEARRPAEAPILIVEPSREPGEPREPGEAPTPSTAVPPTAAPPVGLPPSAVPPVGLPPTAAPTAAMLEALPAVEGAPIGVPIRPARRGRSGRRTGQLGQLGARGMPGLPWVTEVETPQYLVAFELRPTVPRLPRKPLRERIPKPRLPRPRLSALVALLLMITWPLRAAARTARRFARWITVPRISAIPIVGPALSRALTRALSRVKLPAIASLPVIGPPLARLISRVELPDLTKLPVVGPLLARAVSLISLPKLTQVKDALLRPRLPQRLSALAGRLRPHSLRELPGFLWAYALEVLSHPARRFRLLLYAGAGFMVFLFLNAALMVATVNPAFCGACHSMKPEFNAWKQSSHSKVTCYACHLQPSMRPAILVFFYDHVTVGPPGAVAEFITGYHKINAESEVGEEHIINKACERCHTPENRRVTPSRNLKINHEKHLKKGVHCTQCHNRVAHLRAPGYKNNMTMRRCFRCHAKEKEHEYREKKFAKANPKCSSCHPPGFNLRPPNHGLGDWAPPRIPEIQYATALDSPPYYGQPEREKWELQYAKLKVVSAPGKVRKVYRHAQVAKSDVEYCYMCHTKETFCDKCHKTTMPHQRPWFDRHGAVVAKIENKNRMFCGGCHVVPNLCVNCHKRVVYPHPANWAPQHGKQAKVDKGQACWTCHRRDFCKGCHTEVEMPHPKFWLGMHRQYLRNRPVSDCLNCHVKQQCEYCHSNHGVHNQYQIYRFKGYVPPTADGHVVDKLTPGGPDGRLLR